MTQRADLPVELFSAENIHGVAELAKCCFSTPWSEDIYRRELENPQSVGFVCTDGGRVVGMIHCNFVLDELTLNTLCIAPEYRRLGLAKRLWNAVREMMQGVCTVCYLEVRESNQAARRLYERCGFREVAVRKNYYERPREDAVLMTVSFGEEA